jgi:hypothetical protein
MLKISGPGKAFQQIDGSTSGNDGYGIGYMNPKSPALQQSSSGK